MKLRKLFAVAALAIAATFASAIASAQALADYAENKMVDLVFRAQAWTPASTLYVGLSNTACSDSSVGTEISGNGYARVAIASSLANWAGTQSAGSTTASSGTGGQTSNNIAITFPTPTGTWTGVGWFHITDASTGGNIYICQALTSAKTVNAGDTVSFAIGSITVTFQ